MAKKRKYKPNPEKLMFPYHQAYSYIKDLTEEDKAFCLLVWCGMPAVRAYKVCYPTNANAHSLTTMVSRMKMESWLRDVFSHIRNARREGLEWDEPGRPYDFKDYWEKWRY